MTYEQLETFIQTLTPEQKQQTVAVFNSDDELAILPDHGDISEDDQYFDHSDSLGNKEEALESVGGIEADLEDYTLVPKGTVTLHTKE